MSGSVRGATGVGWGAVGEDTGSAVGSVSLISTVAAVVGCEVGVVAVLSTIRADVAKYAATTRITTPLIIAAIRPQVGSLMPVSRLYLDGRCEMVRRPFVGRDGLFRDVALRDGG